MQNKQLYTKVPTFKRTDASTYKVTVLFHVNYFHSVTELYHNLFKLVRHLKIVVENIPRFSKIVGLQ
jgi:hypothetical protein